jgi:hypothetical protein
MATKPQTQKPSPDQKAIPQGVQSCLFKEEKKEPRDPQKTDYELFTKGRPFTVKILG